MEHDITIYLAKATQSLLSAESEFINGRYDSCANRCYYACFQAAIAALLQQGSRPHGERWSHEAVVLLIAHNELGHEEKRETDSYGNPVKHCTLYPGLTCFEHVDAAVDIDNARGDGLVKVPFLELCPNTWLVLPTGEVKQVSEADQFVVGKIREQVEALQKDLGAAVPAKRYAALKEVRPDLVYCTISGFGQDGPLNGNPAYDQIIQGLSGVMSVTGTPETAPLRVGYPVCDTIGGITAPWTGSGAWPAWMAKVSSRRDRSSRVIRTW